MAVRGKDEMKPTPSSNEDSRWPLAKEEGLRREVASMLHGNVQSALSACNVWLAMAERLLAGAHADAVEAVFGVASEDGGSGGQGGASVGGSSRNSVSRPIIDDSVSRFTAMCATVESLAKADPAALDARVTRRIVEAMSLLYKVRGEVERLRKAEVQRAVQTLYPTLINIGLRPALESLLDTIRLEDSVMADAGAGVDEPGGEARATNGVSASERKEAVFQSPALLAVEWLSSEAFMQWDHPTGDEETLNVRLELYRLLETIIRAAHAAFKVFYVTQAGSRAKSSFAAGDIQSLRVDVWLNVSDDCLRSLVHVRGGYGPEIDDKMFGFILQALPQRRFEQAGGTVEVTAAARASDLQIAASLPIA